ncbi:ABC transporter permease [Paenibacillus protaetiae]|uniref:ABC transporter permease n=1 Tax=Paenibacillus protaetiae TaxID=2509456 RepID=A0A4P6F4W7_9BACL|nr:ABC transporter permease [Paenibacillus protaetiae]QAY68237.1 ABC transporter permease [Paenibacillus protaetiae]
MSESKLETVKPKQSPGSAVPVSKRPVGPWLTAWRNFRKNPYAMGGLIVLLIFVIIAFFAKVIAPYDPAKIDLMFADLGPSADHWLGTDELGRDIFSRLVYSTQVSLTVGFSVAIAAVLIGTIIGAISGYFGGWIDNIFMRFVDVMNSLPTLFLNILVLAIFSSKFSYMILIMAFTGWMGVARLVRGTFLQLREMQYVEAAKAIGVSSWGIIFRHLLRNASYPIIVNATLMVGGAILGESALSYLGLGIQAPQTSWGLMLSNSQEFMLTRPSLALYPGLCILILVLAVNFIGDGIQSALNPRSKKKISVKKVAEWRKKFSKSNI